MVDRSRRRVLAGAASLLATGGVASARRHGTGVGGGGSGTRQPEDDRGASAGAAAEATQAPGLDIDERITLGEDEFENWHLSYDEPMRIEYDVIVRLGPSVDVIFFTPEEYQAFLDDYRARYFEGASRIDFINEPSHAATLPAGEYEMVLNNTDYERLTPSPGGGYSSVEGNMVVDVEYVATPASGSE